MSVLSSKDSFKRIDLDGLNLTASSDSNITFGSSISVASKFLYIGTGVADSGLSTDSVTWQNNPTGFPDTYPRSQVAVNNDFTLFYATSSAKDYVSTDGLSWTASDVPADFDNQQSYKPAYGDGKFVTLNAWDTSTPKARYSTNGTTWTNTTTPGEGYYLAYGNGKFVYFSPFNLLMVTSTDAITWSSQPHTSQVWTYSSIDFINDRFMRQPSGSNNYYEHSTDGVTWTEGSLPTEYESSFQGITYGNNVYLALGFNGTVYTSTDLMNWTYVTNSYITNGQPYFTNGKFYITGEQLTTIYSSTDGQSWTSSSTKPNFSTFSILQGYTIDNSLNINSNGISTALNITAGSFIGDGSLLTDVPSAPSITYKNIEIFNSSNTMGGMQGQWTVPSDISKIKLTLIGPGGTCGPMSISKSYPGTGVSMSESQSDTTENTWFMSNMSQYYASPGATGPAYSISGSESVSVSGYNSSVSGSGGSGSSHPMRYTGLNPGDAAGPLQIDLTFSTSVSFEGDQAEVNYVAWSESKSWTERFIGYPGKPGQQKTFYVEVTPGQVIDYYVGQPDFFGGGQPGQVMIEY
jgi:hypothetical protein